MSESCECVSTSSGIFGDLGDCFTTGFCSSLVTESSLFVLTSSWYFGAFWGCFTKGSFSSSVMSHVLTNSGAFVLFGAVDLSATVFSCCAVLLTEGSSPNLIGFSASFFICLALSLYADSLAVSSLTSFHLLDTIL